MALLALPFITRRRISVARPQAVAEMEVVTEPAETPEPAVVPVITNPYQELEYALITGAARLQLMRNLRGI
jgi:hypothetical protein